MDKTCRRCGRDDGSPVSYYHDKCFDGPAMEVENHLLSKQRDELLAAIKAAYKLLDEELHGGTWDRQEAEEILLAIITKAEETK